MKYLIERTGLRRRLEYLFPSTQIDIVVPKTKVTQITSVYEEGDRIPNSEKQLYTDRLRGLLEETGLAPYFEFYLGNVVASGVEPSYFRIKQGYSYALHNQNPEDPDSSVVYTIVRQKPARH